MCIKILQWYGWPEIESVACDQWQPMSLKPLACPFRSSTISTSTHYSCFFFLFYSTGDQTAWLDKPVKKRKMKFLIQTTFIGFATLCAAQLSDLPTCAKPCASSLPSQCNLDVSCICSDSSWITGISCCIKTQCSAADQTREPRPNVMVTRHYTDQNA